MDVEVIIERHEQRIKTLERDMSRFEGSAGRNSVYARNPCNSCQ